MIWLLSPSRGWRCWYLNAALLPPKVAGITLELRLLRPKAYCLRHQQPESNQVRFMGSKKLSCLLLSSWKKWLNFIKEGKRGLQISSAFRGATLGHLFYERPTLVLVSAVQGNPKRIFEFTSCCGASSTPPAAIVTLPRSFPRNYTASQCLAVIVLNCICIWGLSQFLSCIH